MERKGLGELQRSTEVSAKLYDLMSRAGHNRRSAVLDAWWRDSREMTYGPHRSALRRAAYVSMLGTTLHGLVGVVGDALNPLLPPGVWAEQWPPLRESVEAAGKLAPLDKAAIRRAAGTG
jgi:hypothetical protein